MFDFGPKQNFEQFTWKLHTCSSWLNMMSKAAN